MTYSAWGTAGLPGAEQTLAMLAQGRAEASRDFRTNREGAAVTVGRAALSPIATLPTAQLKGGRQIHRAPAGPNQGRLPHPWGLQGGMGAMPDTCADAQGVALTPISVTETLLTPWSLGQQPCPI